MEISVSMTSSEPTLRISKSDFLNTAKMLLTNGEACQHYSRI